MSNKGKRPIVLVANTSWYLYHYRKELIKRLKKYNCVITISPFDKNTKYLEKQSLNILWKISPSKETNLIEFIKSLFRMILIIRTLKPKLIHSHTIKANFVVAFVSFIFNTPNVLSFAGLGRLSKGNIIARNFLKVILKTILFLSTHTFSKNKIISNSFQRGYFIFQNPRDLNYFYKNIDKDKIYNYSLIYGSGIPKQYFKKNFNAKYKWITNIKDTNSSIKEIDIVFCGRLLISKGIELFIKTAKSTNINKAYIFGSKNVKSSNFISSKDICAIKRDFKNIKFMGNVKDPLIKLNSKKPILIVPSFYGEGISRTILEAMCLGIPVICSRNATVEVFSEDVLYVPKGDDFKDYIECIKNIDNDYKNNILKKKIWLAKKWCNDYFKEEKIVDQTIKVYRNLGLI